MVLAVIFFGFYVVNCTNRYGLFFFFFFSFFESTDLFKTENEKLRVYLVIVIL